MAKQTKQDYFDMGKQDYALLRAETGSHATDAPAVKRLARYSHSYAWQARAYMDGYTEAQDTENGYYTPAAIWMRTAHADRLAILHQAQLPRFYAGKAFDDMRQYTQECIAAVINGDNVPADLTATEPAPVADVQAPAREKMVAACRERAEALRRKYGYIISMDSVPYTCKLQGPRHAPGTQWPNGERIASSQFRQVVGHDAHGKRAVNWQWAAFDESGMVLQVVEYSDLWTVREIAAYNIADGSRFVRSQLGH